MSPHPKQLDQVAEAVKFVKSKVNRVPQTAICCGSGLGLSLLDCVKGEELISISFSEIPNFPKTETLPGHNLAIVFVEIHGKYTAILLGRLHYYQGHTMADCSFPIRLMVGLGVQQIIISNAVGAIDQSLDVGEIVVIEDHISFLSLAGHNPLRGSNIAEYGPRFPSLTHAYRAPHTLQQLRTANSKIDNICTLKSGVYGAVGGPTYETPAEVRFLRAIGVSVVGMSSVGEVITAVHAGVPVVMLSLVTNKCVDDNQQSDNLADGSRSPNHAEVVQESENNGIKLTKLILSFLSLDKGSEGL